MTAYLLNDQTRELRNPAEPEWDFKFHHGDYRVIDEANPEASVAYEEDFIRKLCDKTGFSIERIVYGSWSGRAEPRTSQDVLVLKRVD